MIILQLIKILVVLILIGVFAGVMLQLFKGSDKKSKK